eukprot:6328461-Karenia_brevis.AAC.1
MHVNLAEAVGHHIGKLGHLRARLAQLRAQRAAAIAQKDVDDQAIWTRSKKEEMNLEDSRCAAGFRNPAHF